VQDIQDQLGLWEQLVPQVEWEVFVSAAKPSYEMIFKCVDGAFGNIATMDVLQHQLKINIHCCKEVLEGSGCFVVQVLKAWSKSSPTEVCMEHLEGHQDGVGVAILEWLCQYGIAVMVIEDHDVIIASAGWGWKFAILVRVDLAQGLNDGGKTGMQLVVIRDCLRIIISHEFGLDSFG